MTDVAANGIDALKAPLVAKPQKAFAAAFAVLATVLAGCASGLGINSYDTASVGVVTRVEEGQVVGVRPIHIEGSDQAARIGTLAGPAGRLAGSEVGGGRKANTAGAIGGAVLGGMAGQAVGRAAAADNGFAYTVRLRTGELVSVAQTGAYAIPEGTPVVIEYGARARVIPQNASIGYY
ncbi:MAG: hypothetical protein R3C46_08730 [Hyphomonadaceae bacterium]